MINAQSLLNSPLFLGLSTKDMENILHDSGYNMRHFAKGSTITQHGEESASLLLIQKGWVTVETPSSNGYYCMQELLEAPTIIEADKLFGITHRHRSTYKAYTPCEMVEIPKDTLQRLLTENLIIRINFMNIICRKTQTLEQQTYTANASGNLKKAICLFIRNHCTTQNGQKILHIKMTHLATELNTSRLNVSIALNELEKEEKIILHRGKIEVPVLQLL